jgi:chemotaxis protein MotB
MAPPKGKTGGTKVIFVKKKAKGHGHHGGAWKVAYADFVTAMMALFMVLWLVSQTDSSTRAVLSHFFRTGVFSGSGHVIGEGLPTETAPVPGGGTPRLREANDFLVAASAIEGALQDALATGDEADPLDGNVEVTVMREGLLIQISDGGDGIVFGLSSSELTPAIRDFLERIAPVLGRLDNQLRVHGHTDARPFPAGSDFDNWDLSFARADAAREVLERSGVRPGQIVGVLAHGASEPLPGRDPMSPENRRLSILAVRRGDEHAAALGRIDEATIVPRAENPAPEEAPEPGGP